MDTHFRTSDLAFIVAGLLPVAAAVLLFMRGKTRPALYLLIAGGFALRLWMAFIDPFINIWDEQFHAMVAKNMMAHPFTPMLYEHPALPFHAENWTMNHHWVHKPPLFLWQIALAMKIFGTECWVVRIPSVLLTTLCIPVIFRMGKLLSGERTGFFAALLFTITCLQVNIVSGYLNTDHNDVVFMCYVLFSFWALVEFHFSQKKKWIVWIGIFSGLAILVKWLPGILVYGAWFVMIIADKNSRGVPGKWKQLFAAFFVTLLVAAPWYVYISMEFPEETKATFALQNQHLNDSLSHPGEWWYHFELLKSDYGWWMVVSLPVAIFLFLRDHKNHFLRMGIVASVVFVYVFYSFVKTRMPLFCLIVSPLLLLMIGELLARIELKHNKYVRMIYAAFIFCLVFVVLNLGKIEHIHTDRNPGDVYRPARIENKKQFENAAATLPVKDIVIFNCGGYANGVACMFYTGRTAYNDFPGEEQFRKLKSQGIKIAVFDDIAIPAYMAEDTSVIKLHFKLVRNGF
jgi:4-amino-4-deoxy-L-arabinose transferase